MSKATPNSPYVRQPQLKGLKNIFPNTWHGGLGVEWLPIKSSAPIPRGIDIGLEAEFTLFVHGLGVGFVPVRKPGKLPGQVLREEYTLEYRSDCIEVHADALPAGARVAIIDDVLQLTDLTIWRPATSIGLVIGF